MDRGYVICCVARSGSSHLCELLRSTGVLGSPFEYFNVERCRAAFGADYPDDPGEELAAIRRYGVTPNGVYGLKMLSVQFGRAMASGWAERLPGLSFVYLQRRDLLGQAISNVRAKQTRSWTSPQRPTGHSIYDRTAIRQEVDSAIRDEARLRGFFARNGLLPLHLAYEDVIVDPQRAAASIGQLIGLDEIPIVHPEQSRFRIQRDELSEAWRERFVAETRDLSVFDRTPLVE